MVRIKIILICGFTVRNSLRTYSLFLNQGLLATTK